MRLPFLGALMALVFLAAPRLDELFTDLENLVSLLHTLCLDLRLGILDIFQKSHALAQFFLHSVALFLVGFRLRLQLL